jgi:plasmid stabilization system protein ParE
VARSVTWTEGAADEFDAAASYIAQASRVYASSFAHEIRLASESLREFAERGRLVPEVEDPTVREIFVRKYRMVYRVVGDRVWILALIHGHRDFMTAWRQQGRGVKSAE